MRDMLGVGRLLKEEKLADRRPKVAAGAAASSPSSASQTPAN
jgi:hypothetical protein